MEMNDETFSSPRIGSRFVFSYGTHIELYIEKSIKNQDNYLGVTKYK